jgi:hypothetical protein
VKADKQIVLDLFFEHFRVCLANKVLEDTLEGKVVFVKDVCVHGSNVFDIACSLMGIELNDVNYDQLYSPFLKIVHDEFKDAQHVKKSIELYYHWLIQQ